MTTALIVALVVAAIMIILLTIRCVFLHGENTRKDLVINNQQKNFETVTIEQRNIMSLNKLCIERWEKSVLDNSNLNQSNYQLLKLVDDVTKERDTLTLLVADLQKESTK